MLTAQKRIGIISAVCVFIAGLTFCAWLFFKDYNKIKNDIEVIKTSQEAFEQNFSEELFKDQLKSSGSFALSQELSSVETRLEEMIENTNTYKEVPTIYKNYKIYLSKLEQNKKVKLDTSETEKSSALWSELLLNEKFDELSSDILEQTKKLSEQYAGYLASIQVNTVSSGDGYSYQKVATDKGTYGVYLIKVSLSSVKVITASASSENCKDNCPTKTLAQHIEDNDGYAGMNGTYFCPPDYADCSNKKNSFDYALYKSSSGKWLNSNALTWNKTGLITFNGKSVKFYSDSSDYDGDSVTSGISNYPTLLKDNDIVVDNDDLTTFQTSVKGTRGIVGVGETNLYLALVSSATVEEAAYVARSLGMKNALNLDGGGSSAMYINGGYVIGPGRSLPNAIVLVK